MSEGILQRVLKEMGYKTRCYSGRGMHNRTCLGFIVDHDDLNKGWVANLIEHAAEHPDEGRIIADDVSGYRSDNMGRDMIIYFPHITYIQEEEEEEEDE